MSENQFDALETVFEIQCATRNQMRHLKRYTQRLFMKCVKQTHVTSINIHLISLNCCVWISDPKKYAVEKRETENSFHLKKFRVDFFSICEWARIKFGFRAPLLKEVN